MNPTKRPTPKPSKFPLGLLSFPTLQKDEKSEDDDDDAFWRDDSFRVTSASVGGIVLLVAGLLMYVHSMRGKAARNEASNSSVEEEAGGAVELGENKNGD